MERDESIRDLQSLLNAIRSSDVVENRIQLLNELGTLDVTARSDMASLVESLTFWEDFTCLDVSQCLLNKSILHVAVKYPELEISGCLGQFLALGTKASIWCGKHLNMTLLSSEESQEEEHSNIFFQLLLDFLGYSAASYSTLARYPASNDKELMVVIEKFIVEQLNLAKVVISVIKSIQVLGAEILKAVQVVLDATIRLCRVYSDSVNWDLYNRRTEKDSSSIVHCHDDNLSHVINIIRCVVEKFRELGILAANDGGSLVSILNLSWKGVVTLLQLGKGILAVEVNVADIVLTLLSLATESLRCAAITWSSSLNQTVSATEAKKIFLPAKFYLINAVRIISQYPSQAFSIYKDIALCVLVISTFRISLSKQEHLKSASEALSELLEPTAFHLLNSLLNSAQVKEEQKVHFLDWLFNDLNLDEGDQSCSNGTNSMDAIFSVSSDDKQGTKILLIGRVSLYINLLKSAPDLEEDVRLIIARKLGWLLDIIMDEDVYSSILSLQVPVLYGSGQAQILSYQPIYSSLTEALKSFMIVVSSAVAWGEIESFLLENFFHPHFLCWEMVMELFCFIIRHAETDRGIDTIDKLCLLLRFVAYLDSVLIPGSALRRTARSICMILGHGSESMVDHAYISLFGSARSQLSSNVQVALLMEGFPLKLLSDKVRSMATERIIAEYLVFLANFDNESTACGSGVFGAPIYALSAAFQSLQLSLPDTDIKALKLLVSIIHKYKNCTDSLMKDHFRKLLSEALGIVSNIKHVYASDEMEAILLELQNLFISGSDTHSSQCKPNLALFMAGLSHVELVENADNAKSSAVWELYHMLLRERHWAFVHLALTAFGYFAARTSCNQLWRFVPPDAALSFDLDTGKEPNEERFMLALKEFLGKEMGCLSTMFSADQVGLLVKEGFVLKKRIQTAMNKCDAMEIDADEKLGNRKRKLPDGIRQGMELLRSGLKVIGDGLFQWRQQNDHMESAEACDSFLTQYSRLQDVVAHLTNLAGSG